MAPESNGILIRSSTMPEVWFTASVVGSKLRWNAPSITGRGGANASLPGISAKLLAVKLNVAVIWLMARCAA